MKKIIFAFIIFLASYQTGLSNEKDLMFYNNINNVYGKYRVIGHNYENVDGNIGCGDNKYSKIQNNLFNKMYNDEIGKVITISKGLYEYPYYEKNKSNYFVYNDKDLGDFGGKRDYVFYKDKNCEIQETIMCHKIDNPIYELEYYDEDYLETYEQYFNIERDLHIKPKGVVILLISRKPADYELPLDNDNKYVLQDRIYFILKEDGKVQILKTTGGYYSGVILEKIN